MIYRRWALFILATLVGWSGASCSNPAPIATSSPSAATVLASPSPSSPTPICLGAMPASWATAFARRTVAIRGVTGFGIHAVDPVSNYAYGAYRVSGAFRVAAIELTTGAVTVVTELPSTIAGITSMSVYDPWLVWVEADSQTDLGLWKIVAWNRLTQSTRILSTSQLADGTDLANFVTAPVVGPHYAAWLQPVSQSMVELRVYQFDTKTARVLDRGMLGSPLLMGQYLAWPKLSSLGGQAVLTLADSTTLTSISTPPSLASPRTMMFSTGSDNYLVWTPDGHLWSAQRLDDGVIRTFIAPNDGRHFAQYPMVAGSDLVWWSGSDTTLVDLETGNGFDFGGGSAAAAGDLVVVTGLQNGQETLSSASPSSARSISSCTR